MCMKKILKSIDSFLNSCVDYYDYRIRTGKFIDDIKYYLAIAQEFIINYGKKTYFAVSKSPVFFVFVNLLKFLWQSILKLPLLETIVAFVIDTITILITSYSEIFIVFAFTFPTTILLLNLFETSIVAFLIALIPILLVDIFCVSALYYCIDRHQAGDRVSIWKSFLAIFRHYYYFSLPIITESAIMLETILAFFIVSVFVSDIFNVLQIPWSGSIVFWFIIVFFALLILIEFFILTIIMYQTYFYVLLDHLPFQQALARSRKHLSTFFTYDMIFFGILFLLCILFTIKAVLTFFYLGLTVSFFITIASGTFLAFLFHKKFILKPEATQPNLKINHRTHVVFITIIAFGIINYGLISILLVKEYQPLLSFLKQQQDNYFASQEMNQYTNTAYNYTIKYPQAWTVYQWNDKSVTFYNNYTGTISGGTWMTINVISFNETAFAQLVNAEPGLVLENGQTKNITTKITNMSIQGNDAVNYEYTKTGLPYTQYETHFLIHKNDLMYDIAFISLTNDVANYNSDLFQKIINSFSFTQ
jgi:hypothetical protein